MVWEDSVLDHGHPVSYGFTSILKRDNKDKYFRSDSCTSLKITYSNNLWQNVVLIFDIETLYIFCVIKVSVTALMYGRTYSNVESALLPCGRVHGNTDWVKFLEIADITSASACIVRLNESVNERRKPRDGVPRNFLRYSSSSLLIHFNLSNARLTQRTALWQSALAYFDDMNMCAVSCSDKSWDHKVSLRNMKYLILTRRIFYKILLLQKIGAR